MKIKLNTIINTADSNKTNLDPYDSVIRFKMYYTIIKRDESISLPDHNLMFGVYENTNETIHAGHLSITVSKENILKYYDNNGDIQTYEQGAAKDVELSPVSSVQKAYKSQASLIHFSLGIKPNELARKYLIKAGIVINFFL